MLPLCRTRLDSAEPLVEPLDPAVLGVRVGARMHRKSAAGELVSY